MRVQLACLSLRGFRLLTPRKTLKVITLKHLITKFSKLRNMKDNYIVIGLSGATNAGKTTLCENLKEDFPDAHVINMDDYFVEEGDQRLNMVPEVNHANWEELCAIEFDKLHKDVINWIDTHKESNYNKPAVLIVEGFILFNYKPLVPVFHKKYFLTITKDKCWERRKHRHYIPADPPGYFDFVVWPMYLKNKEELANIRDIEYLDGAEDRKVIYEKVRKDIAALVKPV